MKNQKTIAKQISKIFGDDGAVFGVKLEKNQATIGGETYVFTPEEDGKISIDEVCKKLESGPSCRTYEENRLGNFHYVFSDTSAISVIEGIVWDIGYTDCTCWQGAGHVEDCHV